MDNNQYPEYEEISIKELIQTLIDGKMIIIGITIVALLLASIFTFLIQEPKYESETTLLAMNVSDNVVKEANFENIEQLINNLNLQTTNTLDTYRKQIKSYEIMNSVIEKLELDREKYSINSLRNMITVSIIENTNLLEIKVESTDPEFSSKVANVISREFVTFMNEVNKEKISKSSSFLKVKIDEEEKKLEQALSSYETFLEENESTAVIQNEVEAIMTRLTENNTELETLNLNFEKEKLENELQIDRTRNKLNESKSILSQLENTINIKSTVLSNDLLREYFEEQGYNVNEISEMQMSEEVINENYYTVENHVHKLEVQLDDLINERKIIEKSYQEKRVLLENSIEEKTSRVEDLKIKLAQLENKEQLIDNKITRSKETYKLLSNKFEEVKISQSAEAGEMNIMVSSLAYPNENSVSPNKMLNLAISLVLGLMIGVFVVFLKKAWESEEE